MFIDALTPGSPPSKVSPGTRGPPLKLILYTVLAESIKRTIIKLFQVFGLLVQKQNDGAIRNAQTADFEEVDDASEL